MQATATASHTRRETNYLLVRGCALTALLSLPVMFFLFHRPETTGEVHTDEALPEPAAYTRSVRHMRSDNTLRYAVAGIPSL